MTADRFLITEFARRARLPVSALRYYDRIGLLHPAEVDAHSGYRRYSSDQLTDAVNIARLRAIGSSVETIARVLAGGSSRSGALASERRRLNDEIRQRNHALASLDQLEPPPVSSPQAVQLASTSVPALPFTSAATDLSATLRRCVVGLRSRLRRYHLTGARWGALLPLDLDDEVTGHVFADLDADLPLRDDPDLQIVSLPIGNAFRVTHDGPYDSLAYTYSSLLATVECARILPMSPVIERYTATQDPIRTEITIPTASRGAESPVQLKPAPAGAKSGRHGGAETG